MTKLIFKTIIFLVFFDSFIHAQSVVFKWPNGNIKEQCSKIDSDSSFIGNYKSYYENGNLESEGEYIKATTSNLIIKKDDGYEIDTLLIKKSISKSASLPTGRWIYYSSNSLKTEEGNYLPYGIIEISTVFNPNTNGVEYGYSTSPKLVKNGTWKSYNNDGKLEFEHIYNNGKANVLSIEYFANGVVKRSGIFNEIKYVNIGVWKEFDEKGKLISEINYDDFGNVIK